MSEMRLKTKYIFLIIICNITGAQQSVLTSLPGDSAACESLNHCSRLSNRETQALDPGLGSLGVTWNLLEMCYLAVHLKSVE